MTLAHSNRRSVTAKRFCPPAQRCRCGYVGTTRRSSYQPQSGCVRLRSPPISSWASTPLGLETIRFNSQGSRARRASTLGVESQPLWGNDQPAKLSAECFQNLCHQEFINRVSRLHFVEKSIT